MKELQIIIKRPYDGNPLNRLKCISAMDNKLSVGWKFQSDTGKFYGDYLLLDANSSVNEIAEAVSLMLKQAFQIEE